MASKSAIPKQLKEHLKDQQEPFTLNIYLSERGYLVKCLSSNGRNGGCCQINLFKNLWNKKMVLHSTRVVKSVLYKLVSGNNIDDSLEPSCCSKGNEDEFQIADSSSTQASSKLANLEPAEENLVSRCQRECIHDKQIDLMSMLNKLSSDKVHHIITRQKSRRNSIDPTENVKGNFVFASFPWKLLGKSLMERYTLIGFKEAKGTIITQPCTLQYCPRNQELCSQRKSLFNLSDKKPLKNNDGTSNVGNKYNYIHWFICLKNMSSLIGAEQTYRCRKNSRHASSSMSFLDSFEEWRYSKLQRNIGLDLGDAIMDDIIQEVVDLLRH